MMCAKFGTIVMANNALVRDLWNTYTVVTFFSWRFSLNQGFCEYNTVKALYYGPLYYGQPPIMDKIKIPDL